MKFISERGEVKEAVEKFNPESEPFEKPIDWKHMERVAEVLPDSTKDILSLMLRGDPGYKQQLRQLLETAKDQIATGFGIDPALIELHYDLPFLETNVLLGSLDVTADGKFSVSQIQIKSAELQRYWKAMDYTDTEKLEITRDPQQFKEAQRAALTYMIAAWITSISHELYHVRQHLFSPEFVRETLDANSTRDDEDDSLYRADLGERGANAVSIRTLREIRKQLLRLRPNQINAGSQTSLVEDDLDEALTDRIRYEESELWNESAQNRWHSTVFQTEISRIIDPVDPKRE